MHAGVSKGLIGDDLRLFLTTGVLGGFTTYSTFNYETIRFFQDGAVLLGIANLAVTSVTCLVAGGLGVVASRWILGS